MNIKNNSYNCGTRENNFLSNLIYELGESVYVYITRIQDKNKLIKYLYKPCENSKIGLLVRNQTYSKDRKNAGLLAWNEHCTVVKNIDVFLKRTSNKSCKLWHCDNCEYWYDTEAKNIEHKCCLQIKPKTVCPKKHISFKNFHKQQEVEIVIFVDIRKVYEGYKTDVLVITCLRYKHMCLF